MGMQTSRQTPTVALQQATSKFARANAGKTLEKPVGLDYIASYLDAEQAAELKALCPEGKVYVWGSKFERVHQYGKVVPANCLVLFRRGSMVYRGGVVVMWVWNAKLAEYLWGRDTDGQTWELIYFLKIVRGLSIPAREINQLIGRGPEDHWQGLVVIPPPIADKVVDYVKARWPAGRTA